MENQQGTTNIFSGHQEALPNATAVLVLGIISIVGCFCYGVLGSICGIIALVLASKDMRRYSLEPARYTASSYNNLKAGRICAIIGTIMSAIYIVIIIIAIAMIGIVGLSHPDQLFHHYQSY